MAVYIDNARIKYRHMKMSHMVADTTEELIAMADTIGINQNWIQYKNTYREHFDICDTKRQAAINQGAIPVSTRKIAQIIRERKNIMT